MGDAPRRSWAGGPRGTHGSPRGVVDRDGHAGGGQPHGDAGGGAARRKGGRWGGGARPPPPQQRAAVTRGRWRLGGDGGAGGASRHGLRHWRGGPAGAAATPAKKKKTEDPRVVWEGPLSGFESGGGCPPRGRPARHTPSACVCVSNGGGINAAAAAGFFLARTGAGSRRYGLVCSRPWGVEKEWAKSTRHCAGSRRGPPPPWVGLWVAGGLAAATRRAEARRAARRRAAERRAAGRQAAGRWVVARRVAGRRAAASVV